MAVPSTTHIIEPPDVAALAAALQTASREGRAIVPRGSGTKLHWGAPPARVDDFVSTRRLDAPVDHCPGDLTVTLPAGATLTAVNELLAAAGQWLPLDPQVSPDATIGGVVATNDSGPRRYGYGTPRDLIIGIEMVLADGRTAKAGGRVVKNVAGYDLSRLLCGSFGCLAVITSATFKLVPRPRASRTVMAGDLDARRSAELVLALTRAPLVPSAIEIDGPPYRVAARFESTAAAADEQASRTQLLCRQQGVEPQLLAEKPEERLWRELAGRVWPGPGTLLKASVLPTEVASLLEQIERRATEHSLTFAVSGRAALGVLAIRLDGHEETQPGVIEGLRNHVSSRGGTLVVLTASDAVRQRIDPWGAVGDGLRIMRAVKARFDPMGTLSPGRGPGGL